MSDLVVDELSQLRRFDDWAKDSQRAADSADRETLAVLIQPEGEL